MLTVEQKKKVFEKILISLSKYNPTESVLKEINKTKNIYKRECNLEDSKAKLGLETFILLFDNLPTDTKIEIKALLDSVITSTDEVPGIVVRKKPGSICKEEIKEDTPIVIDHFTKECYYEPEPYEPIGKMYSPYIPKAPKSTLNVHKEKRTRTNYNTPSYVSKDETPIISNVESVTMPILKFGVSTKVRKKVVVS